MSKNEELGLPRGAMSLVTIAFDVDGTLLNNEETGIEGLGNPSIITLVVLLSKMKNVQLICWSGGGADYAKTIARQLHLTKFFDKYMSKTQATMDGFKPDIAIDDIQDTKLGKVNLIVREK